MRDMWTETSLRDYFAAHALTLFSDVQALAALTTDNASRRDASAQVMARAAYAFADAMLAERGKPQE